MDRYEFTFICLDLYFASIMFLWCGVAFSIFSMNLEPGFKSQLGHPHKWYIHGYLSKPVEGKPIIFVTCRVSVLTQPRL